MCARVRRSDVVALRQRGANQLALFAQGKRARVCERGLENVMVMMAGETEEEEEE